MSYPSDTSSLKESAEYGKVPDGMTYREIGMVLGISHTNVKRIERIALEKLRKRFRQIIEEQDLNIQL